MKRLLISTSALVMATTSVAEGGYLGPILSQVDADVVGGSVSRYAIGGKVGYNINESFSVEGRALRGVGDATFQGAEIELDSILGAYLRAGLPTKSVFYPYAMIGIARSAATVSNSGTSVSDNDIDFSYGVGINVDISEDTAISLEYMSYYDDSKAVVTDVTAFSLSIMGKF